MTRRARHSDPKVAVVGCGYWGKNLVRNFHQLGALACVHDTDPSAAAAMTAAYAAPARSFGEVLTDTSIAGIVIATPAERHAEMAKAALHAGKGVFVEKPLALKIVDAERLCRLAADAELTLMVGHLMRYHPAFEKLKEICANGTLGKVRYAYSHRLNFGKIRTEENILWSFAPHDISMILDLMGNDIANVSATGHSYLNHGVADVTTTHLAFTDGRAADIFVSWLHPFKEQCLVVVGEEGMAVLDDTLSWDQKIGVYPHRVNWDNGTPIAARAERTTVPVDEMEPLKLECSHFLHCLSAGETPRTDGEEGLRVLRVLDAAQRALEGKKTVDL